MKDPIRDRLRVPPEDPITEVQRRQAQRQGFRAHARFVVFVTSLLLGVTFLAGVGYLGIRALWFSGGRAYPTDQANFMHGSIGAELANGLPLRIFTVLPKVFPEKFGKARDWSHFGLLMPGAAAPDGKPKFDIYEARAPKSGAKPRPTLVAAEVETKVSRGLPIGFATGWRTGIEVAWFNCAVCHTGLVKVPNSQRPRIVLGMPANTVDLERLFLALFEMAVDKRFTLENFEAQHPPQDRLNAFERLLWAWVVVPNTRATLIARRSELLPLLDPAKADPAGIAAGGMCTPPTLPNEARCDEAVYLKSPKPHPPVRPADATHWGPGRVDTFNPYKLINFQMRADCLLPSERTGVSDFPSVFHQKPRGRLGMHLHWDGNNASLRERNLSAALGAGVSETTVDHVSLGRVAQWLETLEPPPSPYAKGLDTSSVARGKDIYMRECATCHGYQGKDDYVFEGERLGQVEPLEYVGTDRGRLDSYTPLMEKYQKDRLFCREPENRFRQFKKTNGYANMPLDGLWLRAPYLHNGSVPTLADLLEPVERRPVAFRRGRAHVDLDPVKGGFEAPPCIPAMSKSTQDLDSFCFDTTLPGNTRSGHLYGTRLPAAEKADLLSYLLTF